MRTSYDAPKTANRPPYWSDDAACKESDPDVFFPASYTGVNVLAVQDAKRVCARCPVEADCLSWAMDRKEPDGVWGGLDPSEREALARDPVRRAGATGAPA